MVNVEDMIIEHIEEMEKEFPNKKDVAEIVTDAIMEYKGDWMKLHSADKFDYLWDVLAEKNKKAVKFKPELTAIDTRNSKSAEMVAEMAQKNEKVLDYGCGTGRNIKFIKNNADVNVDGCDIVEQLEKEHHRHEILRSEGSVIAESSALPNDHYGIVLSSHVLNVIESDSVKKIVVADIFQKLKNGGKAVIEVRTKSDVEGAKTKESFGDGWKIKKGSSFTYQEAITKEKMVKLVTEVGFKIDEHIYNSSKHIVVAVK